MVVIGNCILCQRTSSAFTGYPDQSTVFLFLGNTVLSFAKIFRAAFFLLTNPLKIIFQEYLSYENSFVFRSVGGIFFKSFVQNILRYNH